MRIAYVFKFGDAYIYIYTRICARPPVDRILLGYASAVESLVKNRLQLKHVKDHLSAVKSNIKGLGAVTPSFHCDKLFLSV